MLITVSRFISDNDTTLSIVSIDSVFQCFGLEDEHRAHKIPGETRIPAGRYAVGVRRYGGFNSRYSHRFSVTHRGMLEVLGVQNFTDILIHIGNTDKDTAGCLLVGATANTAGPLTISHSTIAYLDLYKKVIEEAEAGNLSIEFHDL